MRRSRSARLNGARKDVFGAIETKLLGTERVTTDNNCVRRDIIPVGNQFIFGYNVHIGLKSVTTPADVFSVYRFENHAFVRQPLDLIADERFQRDFAELFKYYRKTTFARFAWIGPHLFMVFRVSDDVIMTIAGMALSEVKGVASSQPGFVGGLFSRKGAVKGVKIEAEGNTVTLDVTVAVEYGARIPDVAAEIQAKLRSAIEEMTGKFVRAVNVTVQSIQSPSGAPGRSSSR